MIKHYIKNNELKTDNDNSQTATKLLADGFVELSDQEFADWKKPSFAQNKLSKKGEAEQALTNDLTTVNHLGIDWIAGFDSAIRLDAAKRFAELISVPNVTLTDASNISHTMTVLEAEALIIAVATDYQTKFFSKQAKIVAIDLANDQAELDLV